MRVSTLIAGACSLATLTQALPSITIKGSKFFAGGQQFYLKGQSFHTNMFYPLLTDLKVLHIKDLRAILSRMPANAILTPK